MTVSYLPAERWGSIQVKRVENGAKLPRVESKLICYVTLGKILNLYVVLSVLSIKWGY